MEVIYLGSKPGRVPGKKASVRKWKCKYHCGHLTCSLLLGTRRDSATLQNDHHHKVYKEQMLVRVWRRGDPPTCGWECTLVQPLGRTVWRFLQKLKTELPYGPAIPLLAMYSEKIIIWKDTCTPMFIATLFLKARTRKQPKCPLTDEWIKMWYLHIVEYYLAIKKNEIMPFAATWMDWEMIILSEISHKYHISLICVI